ncbi:NAD(P)/FAD-dependent oxidoreductase [Paenirhodobacter populi]|uniref:NAD(P)/FAD-dependent oxidoreductase n=1 Tax=Paenirhodobacter populi TaxID=2306993 RepID=UPI000FE33A12|nr:FAD-binding oxidoreductase [Sinirhodobacter populi]RWR09122.1 FAD-binding oxidoreductase [Sinirhodobacter populi]
MPLSIPVAPFQGDADLPKQTEVVVIGGGIVGVMTALTLAERGIPVVLCEKGVIGGEQSARNWGWVRQLGRDAAEIPLAIASRDLWRGMNARVGAETGFRETGISYLCYDRTDLETWGAWHAKGAAAGVEAEMLDAKQAQALLPGAQPGLLGALHCASDGRAEPWIATTAMAEAARRAGARILTGCAVRTVETAAGRVSGVVTERGAIACSQVVLAGGVWSRLFAGNLGIDFPQLRVIGTVARVTGVSGLSDMPVGASHFAYRKRLDGDYSIALRNANITPILPDNFRLMGEYLPSLVTAWRELRLRIGPDFVQELRMPRHWTGDAPTPFERIRTLDPAPTRPFIRKALENLRQAFPAFAQARVVQEWAGVMDVTPDAVPVAGPIASLPGFFIASGCSGHGFGIGPAMGQLTADLITGATPIVDPAPFSIARLRPKLAQAA